MLSLLVARPGPVCDGLVALLGANPDIRKLVQTVDVVDALDFVQTVEPDIILIHAVPRTTEIADFIQQLRETYQIPVLAVVDSNADRAALEAVGVDIVAMAGLPSVKLSAHITSLLKQETEEMPLAGMASEPPR